MKKLLLISFMFLAMTSLTMAQIIEGFECVKMNLMLGDTSDHSSMTVVPNPDTANNHTAYCVKFYRSKNGVAWGGFYGTVATPVDMTVNKFIHAKVWKPRISPVKFKVEGGPTGPLEIFSKYPQTVVNGWEDIVFDFRALTGSYPKIQLMPDFQDPVGLTSDIVIYFDQIMINNDSLPNSPSAYMIEDYENIPLNYMLNGPNDSSYMVKIPNPDKSGINRSDYVIKFLRDKDGSPWDGFWSPTPVDVTTNKYMHVKVWKPRITPIKFKIEKTGENHEIFSKNAQTIINGWEDIVFDYTAYTGPWTVIAFLPDDEDPVTLTSDIVIYFDDIILNNNPNPILPPVQTLNVDMHGQHLTAGQKVYLSGDFGGDYGTWAQPGTIPGNEMTDSNNDSIYSLSMQLSAGTYKFKFFKDAGWGGGESVTADRTLVVNWDFNNTYKFGVSAASVTFNVNMKGSGLAGEPVYVAGNFGGIYGTWNAPGDNPYNMLTAGTPATDSIYSIFMVLDSVGTYQLKFFKGAGWNGGEWTGDPNRIYNIRKDTTFNLQWGLKYPAGINPISLAGNIQVYPNPVQNLLNIITATELNQVIITSMVGQEVFRLDNVGIGRRTINISELSTGMYFITFYGKSGGQFTQKILKY